MMEKHRQGLGKQRSTTRRVDIGTGRMLSPAESRTKSHDRFMSWHTVLVTTAAIILFGAILILAGCASQPKSPAVRNSIEIESIRLTAAGHYIDLRYRVLDAERANEVLGPGVKPLLIDEATGTVMAVPTTAKLGSLRQTRGVQKPDRSYFVLFVNNAGLKSGSRVTAEIGDMKFESLTIE